MVGFIIWTICTFIFVMIGVSAWKAKEPATFFTGEKPPRIPEANITKFNHSVAKIWFVFSAFFEALGMPLLLFENSPLLIFMVLGAVVFVIGMIIAYLKVQSRYMKE